VATFDLMLVDNTALKWTYLNQAQIVEKMGLLN